MAGLTMAGSIYDRMMGTPQYDSNAGTSALNAAANAFQGMASTFNTMRQSIIDEEQKNLQREMEKQHHRDQMDYQNRSLAQADRHHTEDTEFNRWKTEGDWRQKELDRVNQLQIAGMRSGGGGGGKGGKKRGASFNNPLDAVDSFFLSDSKQQPTTTKGSKPVVSSPKESTKPSTPVQQQVKPDVATPTSTPTSVPAPSTNPNESASNEDILKQARESVKPAAPSIPEIPEIPSNEEVYRKETAPIFETSSDGSGATYGKTESGEEVVGSGSQMPVKEYKVQTQDFRADLARQRAEIEAAQRAEQTQRDILGQYFIKPVQDEGILSGIRRGLLGSRYLSSDSSEDNAAALEGIRQDFLKKPQQDQINTLVEIQRRKDPELMQLRSNIDASDLENRDKISARETEIRNKVENDVLRLSNPIKSAREIALEQDMVTPEERRELQDRFKQQDLARQEVEARGDTVNIAPSNPSTLAYKPSAIYSDEQLFNSNGVINWGSVENVNAIRSNPVGKHAFAEAKTLMAEKNKKYDRNGTYENIASYVGHKIISLPKEERQQYYMTYQLLADLTKNSSNPNEVIIHDICEGLARGTLLTFSGMFPPTDPNSKARLEYQTASALGHVGEKTYSRYEKAQERTKAARSAERTRLGITPNVGYATEQETSDALTAYKGASSESQKFLRDQYGDHYSWEPVQAFLKKHEKNPNASMIAATAFKKAFAATFNDYARKKTPWYDIRNPFDNYDLKDDEDIHDLIQNMRSRDGKASEKFRRIFREESTRLLNGISQ